MSGYHKRSITKGKYGDISKVQEEVEEFIDAQEQGNKLMAMLELSDIYGALEAVTMLYGLTMSDLKKMSDANVIAFQTGRRK